MLKTIPFDILDITVLTVEYRPNTAHELVSLMKTRGYTQYKKIDAVNFKVDLFAHDYVFVKNSYMPARNSTDVNNSAQVTKNSTDVKVSTRKH